MAEDIPKRKGTSKEKLIKTRQPIKIIIPKIAIAEPIQKFLLGLLGKNKKAITPTNIGAKLVSKVACVAEEPSIARFQQ